ncbi:hypothetical protein Tcan_10776 [Toxocara canis]|uniref:Uncharacterized protein n=1 Tax=Toxocara canis TaxID=6265 RepID=A0A0B2VKR8_TOXCA|nr:hypothetical protein Tcan_10776 [Toxocara canis]
MTMFHLPSTVYSTILGTHERDVPLSRSSLKQAISGGARSRKAPSSPRFKQSLSDAQAEKAKSVPSRNGALGISVEEGKCSKTKGQVKVAAKPGSHTRNKSPQKEVH